MKNLFILIFMCSYMVLFGQENTQFQKLRFNIMGGPSYLISSSKDAEKNLMGLGFTSSTAKDYYKGLKWSWQGNADVHYMIQPKWGVGLKYAFFKTDNKKNETFLIPASTGYDYSALYLKESMRVHYVGPSFYAQDFIGKSRRWKITGLLSVGYAGYRDKGEIAQASAYLPELPSPELSFSQETSYIQQDILLRGNTIGRYVSCGMEYLIHKNIGIGFDLSYMNAVYKKLKGGNQVIDLGDKAENVSRLEASLGIRIYL